MRGNIFNTISLNHPYLNDALFDPDLVLMGNLRKSFNMLIVLKLFIVVVSEFSFILSNFTPYLYTTPSLYTPGFHKFSKNCLQMLVWNLVFKLHNFLSNRLITLYKNCRLIYDVTPQIRWNDICINFSDFRWKLEFIALEKYDIIT